MIFLGQLLSGIIRIYMLILTVRIFLSWFRLPDNKFTRLMGQLTDPVLAVFQRICPLRIGFFDLSPMIPLLLLSLGDSIVTTLLIHGRSFSLGYIVGIFVYIAQFFINIFSFIIAFSSIILIIADIFFAGTIMPLISMMRSFLSPAISWLQRHLWINSRYAIRIYYLLILLITAGITTLAGWGLGILAMLCAKF